MKFIKEYWWVILLLNLFIQALAMMFVEMHHYSPITRERTECEYKSILSFFPYRVIACELRRHRW